MAAVPRHRPGEELGDGEGLNVNFPVPPGATGDVYDAALDAVAPRVAAFAPTWVLMSCGFDSHRDDLIGSLGLREGDFADLARRTASFAPPAHRILFLEGGYDTDAIAASSAACAAALVGEESPARRTAGGPGMDVVETVARLLE